MANQRRNRTTAWLLGGVTLVLLVVWISSPRWYARLVVRPHIAMAITGGQFWISMGGDYAGWNIVDVHGPSQINVPMRWSFGYASVLNPSTQRTQRAVNVPLWTIVLICAVLTLIHWRRRRMSPEAGHCAHCGYDLRAVQHTTCPECGQSLNSDTASVN